MIKLAAFDLDQTLFGPDLTFSRSVKYAIRRALGQGVIVTLATGRGPKVTARFARDLGLTAPFVSYQGGMVYDPVACRVLHEVRLPEAMLSRIVAVAEARGLNLHFEESSHVYLPAVSSHPQVLFELLRVSEWSRVANFLTDLPAVPHKFIVTLNHPGERDATVAMLRAELNGDGHGLDIVPSHPYLVEGLPGGVNKSVGLKWLAESLGIARDEVMAVGDNDNDAEMLAWAGLGVAMADGSAAARAAADVEVPPASEDGAAVALERFVLR